ncbi:unnamed protein product, partial [Ectocarpus sp. 12 AP-2014]
MQTESLGRLAAVLCVARGVEPSNKHFRCATVTNPQSPGRVPGRLARPLSGTRSVQEALLYLICFRWCQEVSPSYAGHPPDIRRTYWGTLGCYATVYGALRVFSGDMKTSECEKVSPNRMNGSESE